MGTDINHWGALAGLIGSLVLVTDVWYVQHTRTTMGPVAGRRQRDVRQGDNSLSNVGPGARALACVRALLTKTESSNSGVSLVTSSVAPCCTTLCTTEPTVFRYPILTLTSCHCDDALTISPSSGIPLALSNIREKPFVWIIHHLALTAVSRLTVGVVRNQQ